MGYTIRLPLSGMKIKDIKGACGISEELITVNKEENTAVIQAETWEQLMAICSGLTELIDDFQLADVLDDETYREIWSRCRFK